MSPYRSSRSANGSYELRLVEPVLSAELLLVSVVFGSLLFAAALERSALWACLFAGAGALVAMLVLHFRRRAWIVMMPREERLRVVRLHAFSYSAATLRLSDAMSVECAPVGKTMWLFVVAKDGRAARVIPAMSMRMIERVQTALEDALKSSETRPGTPSPR